MEKITIEPVQTYCKTIGTAPDKSITHRAVLLGALAEGDTRITNALTGRDCLSTVECMRRLGAEIRTTAKAIVVTGTKRLKSAALNVGNSGTTMRLLAGVLSGAAGESFTLDGDESVRTRPMSRVAAPLARMGAEIVSQSGRAPLRITGAPLHGVTYRLPVASAQVKSAVLLAGLCADGRTTVVEPLRTRDHTERMLARMGADIAFGQGQASVTASRLTAADLKVPGDISSAAYPLVLAACVPDGCVTVRKVGYNATRTGILDVFAQCGVRTEILEYRDAYEPTADIRVRAGPILPFRITGAQVPSLIDEVPVLAVLACFAEGESVVSGAAELKVKESNRIDTTVSLLRAFGADAEATADGMRIRGKGFLEGGCTVDSRGDHRIAMAAAVAAACSRRGATILGPDCVSVSYPGFFTEVL